MSEQIDTYMSEKMPPWVDQDELVMHWVARGYIPPPRKRGGKFVWRRADVVGGTDDALERITDAVRREIEK